QRICRRSPTTPPPPMTDHPEAAMLLHRIPPRPTRVRRARTLACWLTSGGAVAALVLQVACGASTGTDGGSAGATLSGTVRAASSSAVLEGATINFGPRQTTSDANGHFELTGLPVGAAFVQAERPGYLPDTASVTLRAGDNTYDFTLSGGGQVFVSDPTAMYVPAGVGPIRGVIVIVGGPLTNGFVTGGLIEPNLTLPDVEASLQLLGASLRDLAKSSHVALFGTSTLGMPNATTSDNGIFSVIDSVAALSGHPEMAAAPVLLLGFSSGGPEAAGLVSRNPGRTIGLIERKPKSVTDLSAPVALAVPTYVILAGLDEDVDNAGVELTVSANRSRGGLWAFAVEPGAHHSEATATLNAATISWISIALTLRLPSALGDPLIALDQTSGWLGNQTTLDIAPWASYPGDRTMASWLLSQSAATDWQALGREGTGGGSTRVGRLKHSPPPTGSVFGADR
ncbi:MAG: carboxypeptidase regulatory-like domain-containing protein, partial [Gemmatimonadales bacterium]